MNGRFPEQMRLRASRLWFFPQSCPAKHVCSPSKPTKHPPDGGGGAVPFFFVLFHLFYSTPHGNWAQKSAFGTGVEKFESGFSEEKAGGLNSVDYANLLHGHLRDGNGQRGPAGAGGGS